MKRRHTLFYHITVFVIAQLLWLMLLGLWIYWYVSNYIIFQQVGNKVAPQLVYDGTNVVILVGGIILLVAISFVMSLTFRHLNVQLKITRLYDNFIANVTHELKSPLSSIQLYLETLDSRDVPSEKRKEFISMMMKDANRLKNLINSILEISSIEQKRVAHNYVICEAEPVLKEILSQSLEHYNLKEPSVKIIGSANCEFVVDKNALKIVFDNLIDNAIKYTVKPLELIISYMVLNDKLIIKTKDNGIGISIKDLRFVFNKFHRIYNKSIPSVKGTGLGLYLVKEIIKNHGGKISVQSEGLNKGTTFCIELPVYLKTQKHFLDKLLNNSKKNF
jgi:signal transduction histidine kinase